MRTINDQFTEIPEDFLVDVKPGPKMGRMHVTISAPNYVTSYKIEFNDKYTDYSYGRNATHWWNTFEVHSGTPKPVIANVVTDEEAKQKTEEQSNISEKDQVADKKEVAKDKLKQLGNK